MAPSLYSIPSGTFKPYVTTLALIFIKRSSEFLAGCISPSMTTANQSTLSQLYNPLSNTLSSALLIP
jgi:hypothetical protein